jgi:hypothetical protein
VAAKQDKLLEILKTLKPPDAPPHAGRQAGKGSIVDPNVAEPPVTAAPARAPVAGPMPGRGPSGAPDNRTDGWRVATGAMPSTATGTVGGKIVLRLEEIGIFFLTTVVLVVLAFLMGWYGRGVAGGSAVNEERSSGGVGVDEDRVVPMKEAAAKDLGERSERIVPAAAASRYVYSILAARFPPGGEAEAEDHRTLLEERGYSPAWLRPTTKGVELCVGRFEIPTDALALEWLPRLRRLHGAYAKAQVVKIPRE